MPDPTTIVTVTSRDLWLILLGASTAFMLLGFLIAGIAWRRDRAAVREQLDEEVLADLRRRVLNVRLGADATDLESDIAAATADASHFAVLDRIRAEIGDQPAPDAVGGTW